jgi:DNA invertase Pin-like site-specific DNA recombinase
MPPLNGPRAAIYARVSTSDQTCENQLLELRRYCEAQGWQATEYVDTGISGAKDRRPALDQLMSDAKRRKLHVVVCWKLDRFGRSLAHLINAIQTLTDAGVGFTSIGEGIDTRSATGRLMLGILGSFAEFERERIRSGSSRAYDEPGRTVSDSDGPERGSLWTGSRRSPSYRLTMGRGCWVCRDQH